MGLKGLSKNVDVKKGLDAEQRKVGGVTPSIVFSFVQSF